jgi:hypothetical protein
VLFVAPDQDDGHVVAQRAGSEATGADAPESAPDSEPAVTQRRLSRRQRMTSRRSNMNCWPALLPPLRDPEIQMLSAQRINA